MKRLAPLLLLALSARFSAHASDPALSRWTQIDGMAIHYLDSGLSDSNLTLLFVHGYAGAASNFEPLFEELSRSARCVAVDLPGCGKSDKPDISYTIPFYVDFLESFRSSLGLPTFVLVGHSMGAQISLHYINRYPYAERRVILVSPDGLAGEEGILLPLAGLGPIVDFGMMLNNRVFIEIALRINVLYDPSHATSEVVDMVAEGMLSPGGARAAASITREAVGHDPVDEILPSIQQETLIIWGENDKVLKSHWSERFLALLPRAELHLLPECGHLPMIEKRGEMVDLIGQLLARAGS